MAKIIVTGGTGLIGMHLCKTLHEKGYDIAILSRTSRKEATIPTYTWDIDKMEIEKGAFDRVKCIVHLAGANIGEKRWTAKRKQIIIDSRVKTGQLLLNKIKEQGNDLQMFISASAIGYYGTFTSAKTFNESDQPGNDFLGNVCRVWEQTADRFKDLGIRRIKIRTGVVLTRRGGALSKMILPVKMSIGSAIGTGSQYLPWIHIDDLCGIYIKAIEDTQMEGAYNAVAPDHKTNLEITRTVARILNKPLWFPKIPAIAMKLIFGKMSEMLLEGSRVSADKIISTGYNFQFPDLESAITDLLK